ncbi:ABC transporter permease [Kitasatospora sp. NPDC002040]|uniref:ABC transporter permease n=1 Tax=Kitasatospora sp. NPDC002040 TaxID=3154661 RepID=UPI00331C0C86
MSLPPEPTAPDSGVIHNIGYRGYQGPRLGRGFATRSLFVQGLRGAYGLGRSGKSKVLPMLVAAALALPAVVFVAVAIITKSEELGLGYPQYLEVFGIFALIFLASQAPVLMSRDLRHSTVPLYFSRPITRADYVRAKFAAMTAAMMLLMTVPLVLLYLGALLAGLPFGSNSTHFCQGLFAALLSSVLYSALGLLIAAATPRRGFGVAAIMGVMIVSRLLAGIIYSLGGGVTSPTPESANWAAMLSPGTAAEGLVNELFSIRAGGSLHAPGTLGLVVFAIEIAVMIGGSYWLLLRRYRNI